jgi:hypothetical protein
MSSMLPSADAFSALTLDLAKRMPAVPPMTKGARKAIVRQGEPTVRIAYVQGTNNLWRLERHQGGVVLKHSPGAKPPQAHRDPWEVESPAMPRDVALAKMESGKIPEGAR